MDNMKDIVISIPEDLQKKICDMGLDRLTPGDLRIVSRAITHGIEQTQTGLEADHTNAFKEHSFKNKGFLYKINKKV